MTVAGTSGPDGAAPPAPVEFLLEDGITFLNHGSFGACPADVFAEYQRIQRRLEAEPVRFVQRELPALRREARAALAAFVGAATDDLVFVTNPTFAVNEVARSLDLGPGDEVLTTNHEYGACLNAWQFVAEVTGCAIVEATLPITYADPDELVEELFGSASGSTRVLFVSHISSVTALTFPVERICAEARRRGITTVVDGAHAPGQLPLDVGAIGADVYVGTCHKWLCAPKGASFLVATPDTQRRIRPLVAGWGWGDRRVYDTGSPFVDVHEWLGTHDPSAVLTVPAAIELQRRLDWPTVRARCHDLAVGFLERVASVPGVTRVHADDRFVQMALVELVDPFPSDRTQPELQAALFDDWGIEVPLLTWTDGTGRARRLVRVSVQAYNSTVDLDRLIDALGTIASVRRRSSESEGAP